MSSDAATRRRLGKYRGKPTLIASSVGAALLLACGGGGEGSGSLRNANDLTNNAFGEFVELDSDVFVAVKSITWDQPLTPRSQINPSIYAGHLDVRIENRSDQESKGIFFRVDCDDPNKMGLGGGGDSYDGSQPLPAKSFSEGTVSIEYPQGCVNARVFVSFWASALGGNNLRFPIDPPPTQDR